MCGIQPVDVNVLRRLVLILLEHIIGYDLVMIRIQAQRSCTIKFKRRTATNTGIKNCLTLKPF